MNGDWNPKNRVFMCAEQSLKKLFGAIHDELENVPFITFHKISEFVQVYFLDNNIQI